jgi:hypothetical protein
MIFFVLLLHQIWELLVYFCCTFRSVQTSAPHKYSRFTGFFLKFKFYLLVTSVFLLNADLPGFNFTRVVYMFQMMICFRVSASSEWHHLLGTIQSLWRWRQYLSPKTLELLSITRFRNRKEGCRLINNSCENLKTCVFTTTMILKARGRSYD